MSTVGDCSARRAEAAADVQVLMVAHLEFYCLACPVLVGEPLDYRLVKHAAHEKCGERERRLGEEAGGVDEAQCISCMHTGAVPCS